MGRSGESTLAFLLGESSSESELLLLSEDDDEEDDESLRLLLGFESLTALDFFWGLLESSESDCSESRLCFWVADLLRCGPASSDSLLLESCCFPEGPERLEDPLRFAEGPGSLVDLGAGLGDGLACLEFLLSLLGEGLGPLPDMLSRLGGLPLLTELFRLREELSSLLEMLVLLGDGLVCFLEPLRRLGEMLACLPGLLRAEPLSGDSSDDDVSFDDLWRLLGCGDSLWFLDLPDLWGLGLPLRETWGPGDGFLPELTSEESLSSLLES